MVEVGFETKQVDPRVAKFTTTVKASLLQALSFKFMISRSQQFMRHPWHSSYPTFSVPGAPPPPPSRNGFPAPAQEPGGPRPLERKCTALAPWLGVPGGEGAGLPEVPQALLATRRRCPGGGERGWRERDTSGQAQPQPQQQPPRRHGAARHKERYGDPPRRQPPPGRAAGPRGHSSPPGTGPEGRRGAGPARGGWAGNPGPHGVRGQPASGAGGCRGSNCQRCPGSPPLAAEGAGSGGGEAGEPRFPPGRGPAGINPFGADGLIVIPPPRRPSPPPHRGCRSGVCSGPPPRPRSPEPDGRGTGGAEGRRGAAGASGLAASAPPPRWPLPSPTRAPAPRLRPHPLSASSPPSSLPDLAKLRSRPPGPPRPPESRRKNSPRPAGRPPGPSLPAPAGRPAPPPGWLLPSLPRGEPRGAREGLLATPPTVFPLRPPVGARDKQATSDLQKP
ncbi:basic salivary proline-rich protein 2-like [Monodon monoceros]|uniref:basic salivary proline-rich protein 2-like n=1 Tax=Monodon monoceros TaxID=40151 RepID=UPI0010F8E553|nr:basic salivary proline-rich protein 2-like [Monodon monoceros]